eukprot:COSAG01_NODE_555_length_15533_cov_35.243310_4_plen_32_part_00
MLCLQIQPQYLLGRVKHTRRVFTEILVRAGM